VDTVGGKASMGKLAETITAFAVQVTHESRRSILVDLLTVYAEGGRAIVFTKTKREADEVAAGVASHLPCEALHGDMGQKERERALAALKEGRTTVLVATDVAARGLDIPAVDLVVHYDLPQDSESFLHRSGRTGRAGRTGTAIAMLSRNDLYQFRRIIRETKTESVKMIPPPSPQEVMSAAAKQVMGRLDQLDKDVVSFFSPVAKQVLASKDPQVALEAALAALSGIVTVPQRRSLLTMEEGMTTLQLMTKPGRIERPGAVAAIVSRLLSDPDKASHIGRIRMVEADGLQGAVFDVPNDLAKEIMQSTEELTKRDVTLTMPTVLPNSGDELYGPEPARGDGYGRGREGGGYRGGRRDGGYGGGRREGGGGWGRGRGSYEGRREGGGGWGNRSEGRSEGGGGGGWSEGRRDGGRREGGWGGGRGGGGRGGGGRRDRDDRGSWGGGGGGEGRREGGGGGEGRREGGGGGEGRGWSTSEGW
jgi:ATP-dependent RNA helicase DDX21